MPMKSNHFGPLATVEINRILAPLTPAIALAVLHEATGRVLALMQGEPVIDPPRRYLRGRAHPSVIDSDLEMKAFILALQEPMSISALRTELTARFGAERVPSKSAVHRYLRKLENEFCATLDK